MFLQGEPSDSPQSREPRQCLRSVAATPAHSLRCSWGQALVFLPQAHPPLDVCRTPIYTHLRLSTFSPHSLYPAFSPLGQTSCGCNSTQNKGVTSGLVLDPGRHVLHQNQVLIFLGTKLKKETSINPDLALVENSLVQKEVGAG